MISYPNIDPVAVHLGPIKIYWYGLMYVIGFMAAWGLATLRARRQPDQWNAESISDLVFYAALGVIIGGRAGFFLFWDFSNLIHNPLEFFKLWHGGMSFHGGLLGVMIAIALFCRKYHKTFFDVTDFMVPFIPIGLACGRLGNFINSEMWGRVSSAPWAMVFPNGGPMPRHPSQLYEFLLEGVVLFIVLWWFSNRPRPRMATSGLFLLLYGIFRSFTEFYRVPDPGMGYLAFGWLTMGQVLSLPMIIGGGILMSLAYLRKGSASCNNI